MLKPSRPKDTVELDVSEGSADTDNGLLFLLTKMRSENPPQALLEDIITTASRLKITQCYTATLSFIPSFGADWYDSQRSLRICWELLSDLSSIAQDDPSSGDLAAERSSVDRCNG
jgi:hypothetical protein